MDNPPISPSAPASPPPVSPPPATPVVPPASTPPEPPTLPKKSQKTKKPEKVVAKKSKKPLIISLIVIFVLLLVAAGVFCYFKFFKTPPGIVKNDVEFLTEIDAWEKVNASTVIWSFKTDGTGELTTNKENYYPFKWYLSNGKLEIDTTWLYQLSDAFEITLDRDSETPTFVVKNLADETVSTFVPLGTSETAQVEKTEE